MCKTNKTTCVLDLKLNLPLLFEYILVGRANSTLDWGLIWIWSFEIGIQGSALGLMWDLVFEFQRFEISE